MATVQHQPIAPAEEAYLNRFDFEPDAEFTNGAVEERSMGTPDHSDWQGAIHVFFYQHAKVWGIKSYVETRLALRDGLYRVPDVTIVDPAEGGTDGKAITCTPIAVFEVFSPEESMKQLRLKFAQYDLAGIPHIWFVDPAKGVWLRYVDGVLTPTNSFVHDSVIDFEMAEITALIGK
jgi:Uma2 family endonuclease